MVRLNTARLLALSILIGAPSLAMAQASVTYNNVNSNTNGGTVLTSPANEFRDFTYNGASFVLANFNLSGTITSTPAAATTGNFLSDARIQVTRITPASTASVILQPSLINTNGTDTFNRTQAAGAFAGTVATGTTFRFEFAEATGGDEVPNGADNIFNNITISLLAAGPVVPPANAIQTTVGGALTGTLAAGQVNFYRFTLATAQAVSFDTEGTTLSGTNDTELFLFDSTGTIIGEDDDDGTGNLSVLESGDELPAQLAAGTYYLGFGAFNTTATAGFGLTSTSTQTGAFRINGLSVPEPTSIAMLSLGGLAALRRRRA